MHSQNQSNTALEHSQSSMVKIGVNTPGNPGKELVKRQKPRRPWSSYNPQKKFVEDRG